MWDGLSQSCQYPVACPSSSFTLGITLYKWSMYLLHFCSSTVLQKFNIPSTSSLLTVGLTYLRIYSFISCQRFSMDFKSGDSARVHHQLIPTSLQKFCTMREQCFRSLSYINLCESGNFSCENDKNVLYNIMWHPWFLQKCKSL